VLPALRGDFRLANSYVPEPGAVLPCPITTLNGHADPQAGAADAEAWREHTTGGFAFHEVRGGHFFSGTERPAVLRVIRAALEELFPVGGPPARPDAHA
jgi:pyochelin biosynthesis protein PchC